jgi:hypothetical protein
MDFLKNVGEKLSPDQPYMKKGRELLDKVVNAPLPKDNEQLRLTVERLDQQDVWNDVFSTKLIEVLDKIDGVRSSVRASLDETETARGDAAQKLNDLESLMRSYADGIRAVQTRADDEKRRLNEMAGVAFRSNSDVRRVIGILVGVFGVLAIGVVLSLWFASRGTILVPQWAPMIAIVLVILATGLSVRFVSRAN